MPTDCHNRRWFIDLEAVLSEICTWPVEDRLQLVEEVWDGLNDERSRPMLSEDLKTRLDRRLASLDANPQDVTTWEAIKEYLRRPRACGTGHMRPVS